MTTKKPEELLADASAWWNTSIIDIHPGKIAIRGYPIQDLIGRVRFPEMIWLMLRGELPTPRAGRAARGRAGSRRRPRPARAFDRDRSHGRDMRPSGQRCHGFRGQRSRRRPWRRRPAMHGALSRRSTRSRHRSGTSSSAATRDPAAYRNRARRSCPGSAIAFIRSIRGRRRCSQLVAKAERPESASGRYAAIGRAVEPALEAIKSAHPDEYRRHHRGDLLRAGIRAGARTRTVHPVALGRHSRARLGAEAARPPHQGPDAQRIPFATPVRRRPVPPRMSQRLSDPRATCRVEQI